MNKRGLYEIDMDTRTGSMDKSWKITRSGFMVFVGNSGCFFMPMVGGDRLQRFAGRLDSHLGGGGRARGYLLHLFHIQVRSVFGAPPISEAARRQTAPLSSASLVSKKP